MHSNYGTLAEWGEGKLFQNMETITDDWIWTLNSATETENAVFVIY